jgi:hypothetical protein
MNSEFGETERLHGIKWAAIMNHEFGEVERDFAYSTAR